MKTFRIIATVALGAYFATMALQFSAICMRLVRDGLSPFAPEAPPALFTNFLVCALSALAIWALWRFRGHKTRTRSTDR